MHTLTLRPPRRGAARDITTVGVLLALAAAGCSNALEPPRDTPHMSGTWSGTAPNVAITLTVGSIQNCGEVGPGIFCAGDSGPITGGSYSDATLSVQGGITPGGYYIESPFGAQMDITDWSVIMYPTVSDTTSSFTFGGSFASATTVAGTTRPYGRTPSRYPSQRRRALTRSR
jgi:hypothetical protein